ncbi:Protein of uncharacterised function (DUF3304) [Serratia marcescens]|nr:Protein of uncharacterised function (DUF3304) [Serratia marcescens]
MLLRICVLAGGLLLTGCSQPAAQAGGGGGTIKAINHTKWAINHFSVDNQSGIDIIGPFQGGRWRLLLQCARPLDAGYDGAY